MGGLVPVPRRGATPRDVARVSPARYGGLRHTAAEGRIGGEAEYLIICYFNGRDRGRRPLNVSRLLPIVPTDTTLETRVDPGVRGLDRGRRGGVGTLCNKDQDCRPSLITTYPAPAL